MSARENVEEVISALVTARRSRGWSQSQVATSTGMHWTTVSRVERGSSTSAENVARYAEAVGLRLALVETEPDPRSLEGRVAALEALVASLVPE